ncbi:MAG: thioredoxin-like domain-containing protein [Cyclobacteriaceae bacterium]
MKNLNIVIILSIIGLFSCKSDPEGFVIRVYTGDISDGTLFYLKNWSNNQLIDSANVRNGNFSLTGILSNTEHLLLYGIDSLTNEFIYTNLLIGNEKITIKASKQDFPWNIDAKGSPSQDIAEKFNQIEYQRQILSKKLKDDFETDFVRNKVEGFLNKRLQHISDSQDKHKVELIKENFNSYAALINFKYFNDQFANEDLANLYKTLSSELKQSKYGKAIKTQIDFPAPEAGDSYHDFTAVNQHGDTMSLSEKLGKYVLIHFSSSGCLYSKQSIPELKKLYDIHEDKFEIVTISEDVDIDIWRKSIAKDSIMWTSLWYGNGEYSDAVIKYGIKGTPNYVLISPDQKILEKWFGYRKGIIKQKLESYLTKS